MIEGILVSDFDGVICDSVHECMVSSHRAYQRLTNPRRTVSDKIAPDLRKKFRQLRPYVRSGEDYIVLWDILNQGVIAQNQAAFDDYSHSHAAQIEKYREALYSEREQMLRTERRFWLDLNPLFKASASLRDCTNFERIHILSTKRSEYVLEILDHHGIDFPKDRVIFTTPQEKVKNLTALLSQTNSPQNSAYVEDQIEFLIASKHLKVMPFLAGWGYVCKDQKERAKEAGIETLTPNKFKQILEQFTTT